MLATYNKQDNNTQRLEHCGIKLLYNNEWTESSLLGRAEWIKYFGILFDKKAEADSIFFKIESNYKEATQLATQIKNKKSVMVGSNFKGTWYVPGGKSFMGQLLNDAGAEYYFSNTDDTQSIPLNFETVLDKFYNADVWLNAPTATMQELFSIDPVTNYLNLLNTTMYMHSWQNLIKMGLTIFGKVALLTLIYF